MATTTSYTSQIESKGMAVKLNSLSLDIRSINSRLSNFFQSFSECLTKLSGSDIFTSEQVRQIKDKDNIFKSQCLGKIVFRNSIDKLQYLLDHRKTIYETLGYGSNEIYSNRRNYNFIYEALAKLDNKYDLGEYDMPMQLYISKTDNNNSPLENDNDWIEYILTNSWIYKLVENSLNGSEDLSSDTSSSDFKIKYISNMISGMVTDHEQLYHSTLETFDETQFLNSDTPTSKDTNEKEFDPYIEAYNKLNSFNKLTYGFYEIFKPIGQSTEKYIKVKMSSSGRMDIQGVLGLSDCTEIPWEHGSMEYLRSLNTENKRYEFRLDCLFNDGNSKLWWKPDDAEAIELTTNEEESNEEEVEDSSSSELVDSSTSDFDHPYAISGILKDALFEIVQSTLHRTFNQDDPYIGIDADDEDDGQKWRYYKEYETERFLRWFGSTRIPKIDLTSITKKTICSAPKLSSDTQSDKFFNDTSNITGNLDLSRNQFDENTSLTLLSLAPKATIDIVAHDDGSGQLGQYLVFTISGHQQTYDVSFHIIGDMLSETVSQDSDGNYIRSHAIEEINHYGKTLKRLDDTYRLVSENLMYLDLAKQVNPTLEDVWSVIKGQINYIPNDLVEIREWLETIGTLPTSIDLLRLRNIDFNAIQRKIKEEIKVRTDFIGNMSSDDVEKNEYISSHNLDKSKLSYLSEHFRVTKFYNEHLEDIILNYESNKGSFVKWCDEFGFSEEFRTRILKTLEYINNKDKYNVSNVSSYETTIEKLRERILTFNNLIVRLPTTTRTNRVVSLHIFYDWKNFVDKSILYLVDKGYLHPSSTIKVPGTDSNLSDKDSWYDVIPYKYMDENGIEQDFIDYSSYYKLDEESNIVEVIHDRWDIWSDNDFLYDDEMADLKDYGD